MNSKHCKKIIKIMEKAYNLLKDNGSIIENEKWIKLGVQNIRLLNKVLRENKKISVGEKTCYLTAIGILKYINLKLKQLNKKGDGIGDSRTKISRLQ